MPSLRSRFIVYALCLSLVPFMGCASTEKPKKDFTGLSGKISPDAETNFSKARILWTKRPGSVSGMEVCSDPQRAVALLDAAIAAEPKYAEAYLRRGLAKSDMGRIEEGFTDASTAIRLQPLADSYAYRGLISLRGKNYMGARKDLKRSLEIEEDQHLAWNFLANLEFVSGTPAEGCKNAKEACSNGDCSYIEKVRKEGLCR